MTRLALGIILMAIVFIVLFVGMCVAYGWYAWWSGRKEKRDALEDRDR